jgi:CHAD domain-containing protein
MYRQKWFCSAAICCARSRLTAHTEINMSISDLEQIESDPKQLLLQALDRRWENYCAELENCRIEFTEESVHDLRVATRRMLALVQLLYSISPRTRLKKMYRAFKDQLDEFNTLRDTQVILAELNDILHELPQLEEFEKHLRSLEVKLMEKLRTRLENRKTSDLEKWVQKTQGEVEAWGVGQLRFLVLDAVDDAFLTAVQRLEWVDLARSSTIHRVRVAFKAFRYMVEIVHPLLNGFPIKILKQMNDYQTLMGNIQDAEVFAQTLFDFSNNSTLPDQAAARRYSEKRRDEAISGFINSKDRLRIFWRPAPDQLFPWE